MVRSPIHVYLSLIDERVLDRAVTLCRVTDPSADPRIADLLRIGAPERRLARLALDQHLADERIDEREYQRRLGACQEARTRAELREVFADLPEPHPELPDFPEPPEPDERIPSLAVAGCGTLLLGVPVAIVLGIVYGAWWTIAAPVAVVVALLIVNYLLDRRSAQVDASPAR